MANGDGEWQMADSGWLGGDEACGEGVNCGGGGAAQEAVSYGRVAKIFEVQGSDEGAISGLTRVGASPDDAG